MAEDPLRQTDRAVLAPAPTRRRRSNRFQVVLFVASGLFAALAIAAHQRPYFAIDLTITRAIQQYHGAAFHDLMVALTWLGFTPQVTVIGVATMALIWFLGLRWETAGALVAAAGVALVTVVKLVVLRPRPTADLVQVVATVSETSFPSGHVFMATAFCGYLAYLAFTLLKPSWGRTLLVALLAVVIVLMGLSRIYLGQHWFSDVLGGHVLGGLWLAVTIRAYRWGKPKYFVRQPVASAAGIIGLLVSVAVMLAGASCKPVRTDQPKVATPDTVSRSGVGLAGSVNAFAGDLHRALESTPGNLVYSPLSISAALGLTSVGAGGGTRDEMQRVLHFPAPAGQAYEGYRSLFAHLDAQAAKGGARWTLANRIWVQQGTVLEPAFLQGTRTNFGSEAHALDFRGATERARSTINQWVGTQTEGRIPDLFAPGTITTDMRLVLANAVYFKGRWATPFDSTRTEPAPFHVHGGAARPVPTMFLTHEFAMARVPGGRVLELPYQGGELSMFVLLPDAVDGLPAIERRLDGDSLRAWTRSLINHSVRVGLPRFTARSSFELSKTLADLGMPSAFDPQRADFSGMTGQRDLSIGIVVHQAFVEVNEEGTEAAAATGVGMRVTSMPLSEEFLVDRPFLFFIRDRESGCFLFAGRVEDPTR